MPRGTPAPAPFDHADADIILRSSDQVDFRAFKLLLSLSSPFFADIFTLPQPAASSPYADQCVSFDPLTLRHRTIPVIQMAEDAQTLSLLLGLCLPPSVYAHPALVSLDLLHSLADAAAKFEMQGVQTHLKARLVSPPFIDAQPLRVFAIAYRYAWDDEARTAARFTLRHSLDVPFVNELQFISAATFYKLREYHRVCGEVASSRVLLQPALVETEDAWAWLACHRCPASSDSDRWTGFWNLAGAITGQTASRDPRKWWTLWIEDAAKEVKARPWGETVRKWDPMKSAIRRASACIYCGPRARQDLDAFAQLLAVQIERDISSVSSLLFVSLLLILSQVQLDITFDEWSATTPTA
jgi:hypothetical protein